MFRLIAIALVPAFALLGLMGADAAAPYRGAGLVGLAPAASVRPSVVTTTKVQLRTVPKLSGEVIGVIEPGVRVVVLAGGPQGFMMVRDDAGRQGYVPTSDLTALR